MRILETDPAIAARNREQGARAQLYGGLLFAVGMVICVMSGSATLALFPVIGLVVGAAGGMVRDSNRGA